MKAPLWKFFNYYKRQSDTALSIDQYFYFLKSIEALPPNSVNTIVDLREFCKLFWLSDKKNDDLFNRIFDQLIDVEALKNKFKERLVEQGSEGNETQEKRDEEVVSTRPNQEVSGIEEVGEEPEELPEIADESIEFNLKLRDSESGASMEKRKEYDFEFRFVMDDQSIMPFRIRSFAQRLRRVVGSAEREHTQELDLPHMTKEYCKNRYIENIVYKPTESSKSNIVLLSDRFGSMLSYEFLEKQLELSLKAVPGCTFEHYYFYNLPEEIADSEGYKLDNTNRGKDVLLTNKHKWTKDTWFFIFSDAGGLSGLVNRGRILKSLAFWRYLKGISTHVHWLNPVPFEYLNDCTAKRLQFSIPMTYPDTEGLNELTKRKLNE